VPSTLETGAVGGRTVGEGDLALIESDEGES
jgi:hypothetical protein